jgi:uncharacterized protein (DUF362 family)
MPDSQSGGKPLSESMLASASYDRAPRIGVVLSSFHGATEHDGTPIRGLADPRPVDAELTGAQFDAMLGKALELGSRGRRGSVPVFPDEWVVLKITSGPAATDPRLVDGLLRKLMEGGRGKRFTIADASPPGEVYTEMIRRLAARHPGVRLEYADLSTDAYLEVPAQRRTFAARNPQGVYAIPRTIRECDKLITLSPLQTSAVTGVALSVSSYWSMAPVSVYGPRREKLAGLGDPVDVLNDIYLHHPADYAILGGALHQDAAGVVRHNIVIAGGNALSVDAVGAAVMGFQPEQLPLFDKLEARGFGVANTDSIWTRGNEIEDARRPFRKPPPWNKS